MTITWRCFYCDTKLSSPGGSRYALAPFCTVECGEAWHHLQGVEEWINNRITWRTG